MANTIIHGIATRYEVIGSGPPMPVAQQGEDNVPARVIEFLAKAKT
jgi:hypothetical protein